MKIIDGRKLSTEILADLKTHIDPTNPPGLGVLLIGDDSASHVYVRRKLRACKEVGIHVEIVRLPANTPEVDVLKAIQTFNTAPNIDGILVQLPLPRHLSTDRIIKTIDPRKDADGFHPAQRGRNATVTPVLTQAVAKCLEDAGQSVEKRSAVVIARAGSPLVSELRGWLIKRRAKTRIASAIDKAVPYLKYADIVIVGLAGFKNAHVVNGAMLKNGATVIDIGILRDPAMPQKLFGNVDPHSIRALEGHVTPVPGGVGPLTIAFLLKNVVELHSQHRSAQENHRQDRA